MATLASLAIDLTANSAQMVSELQKANGHLDGFAKKATTAGNVLKATFAAATTGVFASFINESIAAGDELKNFATIAGTSTGDFQKLAFAAKSVGIEKEKLADIIKDVNDKVGDFIATGGGAALDFFENIAPKVGVTADQFKNLSGSDALQLYVSTLNKANLSQQEMTFYMEAIASDATALIPLFKDNAKLLGEQADKAERFGAILSEVDLNNLKAAKKSIDEAASSVETLSTKLAASLAPAIKTASDNLIEFFSALSSEGNSVKVLEQRMIELEAAIASPGGGRSRASILKKLKIELKEVSEQMEAAKAISGDVDAIESQRIKTNERLLDLSTQLKEVQGVGRSAIARKDAIREEITALNDYIEKLKEVQAVSVSPDVGSTGETEDKEAKDPLSRVLGSNPEELLERIERQFMSEEELIENSWQRREDIINNAKEQGLINDSRYWELILDNANKAQRDLEKIEKTRNKNTLTWDQMTTKQRLGVAKNLFGDMASIADSGSKTLFNIAKVAAIAHGTLSAAEAVTTAYAFGSRIGGPPLGAVFAGVAGVAQAANLAAIAGTSFGGGGSGGGGGSSNVIVPAIDNQTDTDLFVQSDEPEKTLNVNLNIEDEALLTKNQLRQIVDQINEAEESNVRINL